MGLKAPTATHDSMAEDSEAKALAVARAVGRATLADCGVLCVPSLGADYPGLDANRFIFMD